LLEILKLICLYRELFNQTVNKEVYCAQIDHVSELLEESRRGEPIIFLHDNATPQTAKKTKKKLRNLNWDVLPHAPYSPDTAPSDFHLFRSLKHWLRGRRFTSVAEVEVGIQEFFDSKDVDFYERGINGLIERWEQVIAFNGDYCN
jgi:histone-lysine N-methyltransferase SETMAR